jgi:hypothetical protein
VRQLFCIFVALLCASANAGVKRWSSHIPEGKIDPMSSAALFVGVRDFTHDHSIEPVKYAVDDAVDLAYEVALDRLQPLVDPRRVVLALSGEPQKPKTREKLRKLIAAGTRRDEAGMSDILVDLAAQSRVVGPGGILIIGIATHGLSEDGTQYLLTARSLLEYHETMLNEARILDVAAGNGAPRSLILVDACRERVTSGRRSGDVDPRSIASFERTMRRVSGQVVISAAAAGGYAYDDDGRLNGVFTATVVDGLHCAAGRDRNGLVTVDTLYSYVSKNVLAWVHENKNSQATTATRIMADGESKRMPLSICPAAAAGSLVSGTAPGPRRRAQ